MVTLKLLKTVKEVQKTEIFTRYWFKKSSGVTSVVINTYRVVRRSLSVTLYVGRRFFFYICYYFRKYFYYFNPNFGVPCRRDKTSGDIKSSSNHQLIRRKQCYIESKSFIFIKIPGVKWESRQSTFGRLQNVTYLRYFSKID